MILEIRAFIMRLFRPAGLYWLARPSTKPISHKFGFDRGTPIDRYWIEKFLSTNKKYITGRCLEVTDSFYTTKFGSQVTTSDVLDINPGNKLATVHGDLRRLPTVKSNTYNCLILTHMLGLIDDVHAAAGECYRLLKPGGILLFTSSCLGPILKERVYWRFTPHSVRYIFQKYFKSKNISVKTYGNVLAGQYFWVGMSQQDVNIPDLETVDDRYPCIVTMVAVK